MTKADVRLAFFATLISILLWFMLNRLTNTPAEFNPDIHVETPADVAYVIQPGQDLHVTLQAEKGRIDFIRDLQAHSIAAKVVIPPEALPKDAKAADYQVQLQSENISIGEKLLSGQAGIYLVSAPKLKLRLFRLNRVIRKIDPNFGATRPPEGWTLDNVAIEPSEIEAQIADEAIKDFYVRTKPVDLSVRKDDISGKNNKFSIMVGIETSPVATGLPEAKLSKDLNMVRVTVAFREEDITRTLELPVTAFAPDDFPFDINYPKTITLKATGPKNILDNLDQVKRISAFIDLRPMGIKDPASYPAPLQINIPKELNAITFPEVIAGKTINVTVTTKVAPAPGTAPIATPIPIPVPAKSVP